MSDYQKLQHREAEGRLAATRRNRAAPQPSEPAVQRMLNRSPAAQRYADLERALAGSPRVQAVQAAGDRASSPGPARPVVQRMTLSEYDAAMASDGVLVDDLLAEGYDRHLEQTEETASDEGRIAWRNARAREVIAYLSTVPLDRFLSDPKTSQAVQMVVGGIGKGKPLLLPPNPESLADTDLLFRGTTLDTNTGALYVGSGGSAHGSPTTPSATAAALFATKSATENQAPGRIVYGPIGNVRGRGLGFAPPDVMSGQEQEITVAAPPAETNAALGSVLPVEDFRRALRLIDVHVPDTLTAGQAFDDRLERAARNPLKPDQQSRLQTLLTGNPQENIAAWEGLMASIDGVAATLAGKESALRRMRGADTGAADMVIQGIQAKLRAARNVETLEGGVQARAEAEADLALLDAEIEEIKNRQAASSSKGSGEDEDFDLFGD